MSAAKRRWRACLVALELGTTDKGEQSKSWLNSLEIDRGGFTANRCQPVRSLNLRYQVHARSSFITTSGVDHLFPIIAYDSHYFRTV